MAKRAITVSEAIQWQKTLKERHTELTELRNENAYRRRRLYGAEASKEVIQEPLYDVKALDKLVTRVATEVRKLDAALKNSNATTTLKDYEADDDVLGSVS